MELLDAIALVLYWGFFYGVVMLFGWGVDTVLRRFFNCGIFPKDYFK